MCANAFNKSIYHRLTTFELTVGLPLKVFKLPLKINFPVEEMNAVFNSGTHLLQIVLKVIPTTLFLSIVIIVAVLWTFCFLTEFE